MMHRKLKLRKGMATTLSIQDYLTYFLLKNEGTETKSDQSETIATQQGILLLATVYKNEGQSDENVIYSKRMLGGKHADPLTLLVQDMTGKKEGLVNGGKLIRSSSMLDLNDDGEVQLPRNSSVSIDILSSRSPSKLGAEQLQMLLDHCKRNSIKASVQFIFANPFSWDNKYNREGLKTLYERGMKLRPLSFQQALSRIVDDVQDTLESMDEMQTCRGTISINYYMLKRAMAKYRDSLILKSDAYYNENEEKLREILGYKNGSSTHKAEGKSELKSFSLATYRDYFFLQNTDEIWAKLKVNLSKTRHGITQEELLFERIYNSPEPMQEKKFKNNVVREKNPLGTQELSKLLEEIWSLVGDNITLSELVDQDGIVVQITSTMSEYPDRMEWHRVIEKLHKHITERLFHEKMKKVRVESVIRYAMNISTSPPASVSGRSTPSTASCQSSKVEADRDQAGLITECMHVQDILFDMLEDLEDNTAHLGRFNYGRGPRLQVEKTLLSAAMSLLNKATTVRSDDGKIHSMNSDFLDAYSDSMNRM